MSANKHSNFQSNTAVYLLWLGYMFRPLFGTLSGCCITFAKVYILCTLLPSFLKVLRTVLVHVYLKIAATKIKTLKNVTLKTAR